jgi:hypothetical protein
VGTDRVGPWANCARCGRRSPPEFDSYDDAIIHDCGDDEGIAIESVSGRIFGPYRSHERAWSTLDDEIAALATFEGDELPVACGHRFVLWAKRKSKASEARSARPTTRGNMRRQNLVMARKINIRFRDPDGGSGEIRGFELTDRQREIEWSGRVWRFDRTEVDETEHGQGGDSWLIFVPARKWKDEAWRLEAAPPEVSPPSAPEKSACMLLAVSTVAVVAIAVVIIVALIALIYLLPRGGRRLR